MHPEHLKLLPKNWSISLDHIQDQQILYHGKFCYLQDYHPASGGWCHLLLLRSLRSNQKVAIVTQVPDCVVSIVNTIEELASFVVNFFNRDMVTGIADSLVGKADENAITTPGNTTIVEYLPIHCFGEDDGHELDTIAIMHFDWEVVQPRTAPGTFASSYYRASHPEWNDPHRPLPPREALDALLQNL